MGLSVQMKKTATALFFAILMLIGVLTINDYTGSYDESAEQAILASNMKEYALALEKAGIRSEYWLKNGGTPISQSIEKDHGISGYYLYGLLYPHVVQNIPLRYSLWSLFTWLWFMVGVFSLYGIARQIGMNRLMACAASMMLYLAPRFFAEGHLNNKDVVLLCLMLAVLWQGGRWLQKNTIGRGVLFSLAGAFATNTKIVGALAWGLILLAQLVQLTVKRKWTAKSACLIAGTAVAFAAFYALLTPAMWNDPAGFVQYLLNNAASFSRWGGRIFFRNAYFDIPHKNQLPVYYLPYLMLTTLPLYTFPLCLAGQLKVVKDFLCKPLAFLSNPMQLLLLAATGCWVASVGAFVILRPVVYNGWRHFYFAYAGVAVLAAYGIQVIWNAGSKRKHFQKAFAALLCLCFAAGAAGMVVNHPRQSSYYNAAAHRGTMETDYWNTSGSYALEKLAACETRNQDLPMEVGCYFFDIQNARYKLSEELRSKITTTVEKDSPYLYYIENYVQVYEVPFPEGYHVLFEVESYGRKIGTMYEKDV